MKVFQLNLDCRLLARLDTNRARPFPVGFNAYKTEIYDLFLILHKNGYYHS